MNRTHLSVLSVALLAASATANATIWEVTLTKVMLGSDGRAATELKINPAPSFVGDTPQIALPTMRYNDATTTLTMTGKLDLRYQTTPTSGGRLFDHYITNLVINGATGDTSGTTSYECENHPTTGTAAGGFGQNVGANMCGNYTLGDDYVDNSTLAYSGLTVTRTIAGDDAVSGDPQSIATYALLTQNFTAGPGGTLVMQSADWNPTSSAGLQMTFSVGAVVGGGAGQGYPVKLVKYVQLSGTTESVLRWDGGPGCTNYAAKTNCINPANTVMSSRGIVPSTATWDWNPTTGVLSSVGDFNSALTIGSNSMAPMVLGDRVTNLTLNTATSTTSATVYACAEGTFLATVGANGCLNTNIGDNFVDDSTVVYNVGGDPNCIKITYGGDDTAMEGAPRGLITRSASASCDATDGAFNVWTVVQDDTATGGQLIIASSTDITTPDGSYLVFDAVEDPADAIDDTADAIPTVAKSIDVLANDLALADPVTVAINTAPTKGTATVVGSPGNKADVRITYIANVGTTGTDTFSYTVTSGAASSTATVNVTILGGTAGPGYPVKLVKYYQQGTSVARWDGCSDYTQFSNCIRPGTTLANLGVTPSTATWNWDPATGILSSVGDFNSASTISSQAASQVVIGDSVTDLVINTTTGVTTASAYHCIEGTFLSSVGANGCLNTSTGNDFVDDSSAVYNVGGDATCIKVTIGGDDSAMEGAPRGVTTRAASVNCDATDGAFGPWSVAEDLTASGGQLKISNGPLNDANTGVLIFDTLPHAVDDTADAIPTVAKQIDVLANDVALADPVTVAINTAPTKGTATVVGSPGNAADVHVSYTGNSGATGTDTFTYDVTTGSATSTATVTVTLLDDGAKDDTVTTHRNVPVTINVAANDLGFGGSPQLGLYVNPLHGAASVVGAAIRYVSDPDFVGTDTFKYIIDDGTHVGIATVTVHVIDDADNDGIPDDMDNCLGRANADQRDTDGDGFGNVCDADLDNSGTVNFGDLAIFHKRFGTSDPDADFDGNGVVNFADLARFRALFGRPPGPAGSPPAF